MNVYMQIADLRDVNQGAVIESHMAFWKLVQLAHQKRNEKYLRMTPEYGPAPYTPISPQSGEPVTDVLEMTKLAADELRKAFGAPSPSSWL